MVRYGSGLSMPSVNVLWQRFNQDGRWPIRKKERGYFVMTK